MSGGVAMARPCMGSGSIREAKDGHESRRKRGSDHQRRAAARGEQYQPRRVDRRDRARPAACRGRAQPREIVPRSTFDTLIVEDGDDYEIVHFVGGG